MPSQSAISARVIIRAQEKAWLREIDNTDVPMHARYMVGVEGHSVRWKQYVDQLAFSPNIRLKISVSCFFL